MTRTALLVTFLTVSSASFCSQARHLQATGGPKCDSACPSPIKFGSIQPGRSSSYACAASTATGPRIGYQLATGPATCTIAGEDSSVEATDFDCLCKDVSQTQGLDRPSPSGTCASSCSKSLDGMVGKPVSILTGYACLALPEIGTTSRIGFEAQSTQPGTQNDSTCRYAAEGVVQQADQFSCICLYSAATAPAPAFGAQSEVATGGR